MKNTSSLLFDFDINGEIIFLVEEEREGKKEKRNYLFDPTRSLKLTEPKLT